MNDFLNPDKILDELILWPDMKAADFGCGAGGWTIPLAKRLRKGKVFGLAYGLDILDEPLSALQARARFEKVQNIRTLKADVEKHSTLQDNSMDVVLATNIFFQAENRERLLSEIKRVLKEGGQALIVDWLTDAVLGPKQGRISQEEMAAMAEKAGFRVKKEFKAGEWHYGLVLTKP